MPLKKRIFDPLLPKRLAELGIELNTPCVPWRHGGGYIYIPISHLSCLSNICGAITRKLTYFPRSRHICLPNVMLLPCKYGPGTQGPGTIWAREPRGQGPSLGPKKGAVRGLGRPMRPFWVPGLVPGPCATQMVESLTGDSGGRSFSSSVDD